MKKEIQMGPQGPGLSPVSDPQIIIAFGKWATAKYGELEFSPEYCQKIVDHFHAGVMGNRVPFVDVDHDRGEAQGWIKELSVGVDGLYASIEWTEPGVKKVAEKRYRYFSADIGPVKEIRTGEVFDPVLIALSLTNTPVLNILPDVKLSDGLTAGDKGHKIGLSSVDSGHGHGTAGKPNEVDTMPKFEEILKFLQENIASLTPEQISAIAELVKPKADEALETPEVEMGKKDPAPVAMAEGQVQKLLAENSAKSDAIKQLSERLIALETEGKAQRREAVIGKALSEGKIKPADRKVWESRFDQTPEIIAGILADLPANPGFKMSGSSVNPEAREISEELFQLGEKMGYSRKEYAELIAKHG